MFITRLIWLIGPWCRWNQKVSSKRNLCAFWTGEKNYFGTRVIAQVKVQWKHFSPAEATWELEGDLQKSHPIQFRETNEHWGQFFIEGGKDVTSPQNKLFLSLKFVRKLFTFLVNSKLEIFCHLWQFWISNFMNCNKLFWLLGRDLICPN